MTDLYAISVDSVEDATVTGRVHLINPDAVMICPDATLPVELLTDAWWLLSMGYLTDAEPEGREWYPGSRAQVRALAGGMRGAATFCRLHDYLLGETVRVTSDGYVLTKDGKQVVEPRRKSADVHELSWGSGSDETSDYVTTVRRPDLFRNEVASIVRAHELGPLLQVPSWSDVAEADFARAPFEPDDEREDMRQWHDPVDLDYGPAWDYMSELPLHRRPYAMWTVTMADASYVEHVAIGMRWRTAHTGWV
ncbi:hypothetical protein [Stackebrandtia soli]|uniref:hypothetical protein n=1 Tax=Stackebrandtia soli TaxID=1892856 RepID=UPI0039E83C93